MQAAAAPTTSSDDAWENSRLQVQCASLAAENDSLRMYLKEVTENNSALQATLKDKDTAISNRASAAEKATLTGIAEMEHQVDKYKQMLHELAASAELLSKDNVVLSTEVRQLRDRCQVEREQGSALEGRVGQLQVLKPWLHLPVRRNTVAAPVCFARQQGASCVGRKCVQLSVEHI
jgi:regulator of replication initiation timing